MSAIDLSRLIIRKKYFLPLKPSELEAAILDELGKCDPPLHDIQAWLVIEKHKNGCEFAFNMEHSYVLGHSTSPRSKEIVEKLAQEFSSNYEQKHFQELGKMNGVLLNTCRSLSIGLRLMVALLKWN